jgi:hypothetical protein
VAHGVCCLRSSIRPLPSSSAFRYSRAALFLLRPRSGKTHQLRVAMKSQSAPILGDALYGGSPADRAYLHAYALRFTLDDEAFCFVCPPDQGTHFSARHCRTVCSAKPARHGTGLAKNLMPEPSQFYPGLLAIIGKFLTAQMAVFHRARGGNRVAGIIRRQARVTHHQPAIGAAVQPLLHQSGKTGLRL